MEEFSKIFGNIGSEAAEQVHLGSSFHNRGTIEMFVIFRIQKHKVLKEHIC